MPELTFQELESEMAEQLPTRELMGCCHPYCCQPCQPCCPPPPPSCCCPHVCVELSVCIN
jgi:hypothetical protein